jgi:hypothetical protein
MLPDRERRSRFPLAARREAACRVSREEPGQSSREAVFDWTADVCASSTGLNAAIAAGIVSATRRRSTSSPCPSRTATEQTTMDVAVRSRVIVPREFQRRGTRA